ncbi:hypothetical protein [uncultured Lactobacillus sp.]|uniref:hypothetical protein n=1 Tax=uncultured Lactobacillus sp. TaxID=153152 RepID=UPI0026227933|nr:hypothetical protein [uncultured Lactobacillus sp.]
MTDFKKFESTIFSSDDNFAIRKIEHDVILTYRNRHGEKEYESLSQNTYRVFFNNKLEVSRLYPPDEYSHNWLIKILLPQIPVASLRSMSIALTTLERIAQSREAMQLSEYDKDRENTEIRSWFDLRNKLKKISKAFSLIKQSADQTTQWLGSDGQPYREIVLANSLRLNYGQDEIARLVPIKDKWIIQFVKTDFTAVDGIVDQLFAALTLLVQYVEH